MTGAVSEDGSWVGVRVARRIGDAAPRSRLRVTGTVTAVEVTTVGGSVSLRCFLDDGTGQVALLFLGRREVTGMQRGARCTAEGTVQKEGGQFVVWNPIWRIEA